MSFSSLGAKQKLTVTMSLVSQSGAKQVFGIGVNMSILFNQISQIECGVISCVEIIHMEDGTLNIQYHM